MVFEIFVAHFQQQQPKGVPDISTHCRASIAGSGSQLCAILTGVAGTGKSHVVRLLIAKLRACRFSVLVCGASGVAALNVGGRTIHSLFSLSLDLDWQIKEGTILWWMIRNADMIIVDEFSLLMNKLLHTLNDILYKVRRDKRNPFGGITMLLVGDPLQLPAVNLDIFDSALFRNHFVPFVLTEVMRQDDEQFIDLLNCVRIGEETDDDHLTLQQRIAPNNDVSLQDLEDAPMLVGRRNAMHRWNEQFMAQLGSNIVTFNATYVDMGGAPTNQAMCDYINSRNRRVLPQQVFVAAGMRARLIRNVSIQNRSVNSTMVVIKRWSNDVIVVCPIGRTREYPICRLQQITPVYGPSRNSTIGVHYLLVTDVQVDCKSLVVHDSKDASSECGALFRVMLQKIGWSFLWHHYGTQTDSDTCGFHVVMIAMQWCTAKTLTGQLPRWFLAYCASILQMFALDSTTLRSTVHTFQDATYEDAWTMYDEPVICAMTECGALPDITDAELDGETSEHHWTCPPQATNRGPSHPTLSNNEAHPYPSQTRQAQRSKKLESKGGANRKPTPNTPQKPTRPSPPTPTAKPSRRVPKSKRTTMPARHQPPSQAPYRSQPHPPQGGRGEDNPSSRKRTSQQNNGPHSKRQLATGNEQRGGRKRPQPHQDPTAPSGEPPRSRPRAERTPVDHLALTKREITEWSTRITDENTSLRRRKAHALHFLGAQDATAVKGQYRALSLVLHPDKNRTDPMATERFKVLGAAKDLFD